MIIINETQLNSIMARTAAVTALICGLIGANLCTLLAAYILIGVNSNLEQYNDELEETVALKNETIELEERSLGLYEDIVARKDQEIAVLRASNEEMQAAIEEVNSLFGEPMVMEPLPTEPNYYDVASHVPSRMPVYVQYPPEQKRGGILGKIFGKRR